MNFERVQEIADAVLFEGYMLYPYRPSSVKNQQRFNFGVLCPQAYCETHPGSESSFMQCECLLRMTPETRVSVKVRFLHLVERSIHKYDSKDNSVNVNRLEISGRVYQPWQEAEVGSFTCFILDPELLSYNQTLPFAVPGGTSRETLRDEQGKLVGEIVREWQGLAALLTIDAQACRDDVLKLRLHIENHTAFDRDGAPREPREAALRYAMVSVHAIAGVENGEFLSLLDPPPEFSDLASACENVGTWPVLAGDDATTVLASPIILYDYPQIARESAGNLFDATEIDEILSLRILTLTDSEKAEIRHSDDRARQILERTENMPAEQFMKLHGALRGLTALKEDE